jgi:hypothetical protein
MNRHSQTIGQRSSLSPLGERVGVRGSRSGTNPAPIHRKRELQPASHLILQAHLFDISRATDAGTLLACRTDALDDICLDAEEKTEICRAIEKRFALLNAGIIGKPKSR